MYSHHIVTAMMDFNLYLNFCAFWVNYYFSLSSEWNNIFKYFFYHLLQKISKRHKWTLIINYASKSFKHENLHYLSCLTVFLNCFGRCHETSSSFSRILQAFLKKVQAHGTTVRLTAKWQYRNIKIVKQSCTVQTWNAKKAISLQFIQYVLHLFWKFGQLFCMWWLPLYRCFPGYVVNAMIFWLYDG